MNQFFDGIVRDMLVALAPAATQLALGWALLG
jgi:hypothetical protein